MNVDYCTRKVEFRASGESDHGDGRTLEGYAAVFNQDTEIDSWLEGRFIEVFQRGAFKKTLNERTPVMQFNHGRDFAVGQLPIGAYSELSEDDEGLFVRGRLFDNPLVEPVRQAIEGGALSGMSIRFRVTRDEWKDAKGKTVKGEELLNLLYSEDDNDPRTPVRRTIREVQLAEAGPVVFPAYEGTSVGVRATDADRDALKAQYRRSLLAAKAEPDGHDVSKEDVEGWLAAETRWKADVTKWLQAETNWRTSAFTDFEERRRRLRRHLADSKPPAKTDAAHKGTSDDERDTKKSTEEPRKAVTLMNIHELRARAAELTDQLKALDEEFRDTDLPDEKRAEWDAAETELAEVQDKIKGINDRAEAMRKHIAARPDLREKGADPGMPDRGGKPSDQDVFDLEELRASSFGGEDFLRRVADNARRAIDTMTYGVKYREGAQERLSQLLDEVDTEDRELAKRILLTGSETYARAFAKVMRHGSDAFCTQEERQMLLRAQTLVPDSGGGYAVPVQLDPTMILINAGVVNPIRDLARVETIVGKIWQGVTTTGTTVSRGTEGATAPDSSFTLAQPTLTTNRVQGFVPFSIEIELSWNALMTSITRVLVDAKATEENSFITGDGTGTNPGGIIGTLTGQNVATASAGAFVYADVYNLQNALAPRWEPGAAFMGHKAILNLVRQFDTAGGGQFWGSLAYGNPGTILDYKVLKSSAMDNTVAATKKILLYGNFEQFLIADRLGMHIEMIPHVFDAANANRPTGQRGVYAVWMNNSRILVPAAFKLLVVG